MAQARVKADTEVGYHGHRITIPTGTPGIPMKDGRGFTMWAVRDAAPVKRLTGDTHTPTYYWCWVPTDAVEET